LSAAACWKESRIDPSESRNAFARLKRSGADLTRNISHRLERLETRAKEVAAARPEPHTFCFIEPVNKRVTSTLTWENGKEVWTHFDPPRERGDFEPMV
jgi:hypothetical protein